MTDDVDFPPLYLLPLFPPDVLEDETSFPPLLYVTGPSAEKCFLFINFVFMFCFGFISIFIFLVPTALSKAAFTDQDFRLKSIKAHFLHI